MHMLNMVTVGEEMRVEYEEYEVDGQLNTVCILLQLTQNSPNAQIASLRSSPPPQLAPQFHCMHQVSR